MELFFPAANFADNPAAVASDVFDFENRGLVITDTYYLTVYSSERFVLKRVCTLDELRLVAGLLASMHIGWVSRELVARGETSYNGAPGIMALEPYIKGEMDMLKLVSDGESPLLHLAGIAAFLEKLPYNPKVRNSTPHTDALQRLAQVGERIWHDNIVSLKDTDHRLLRASFAAGVAALKRAGLSLGSREEAITLKVLNRLADVSALIVLDADNLKA